MPQPRSLTQGERQLYVPLRSNSLGGARLVKKCLKDTRQCHGRRQRHQSPAECLKPQGKGALSPSADTVERCDLTGGAEERGAYTAGPQARGCGKASLLAELSRFPVPPARHNTRLCPGQLLCAASSCTRTQAPEIRSFSGSIPARLNSRGTAPG